MATVHCVILSDEQMPKAKAILSDIRGKQAFLELVPGSFVPDDFEERQTIKLRVMNAQNEAETFRGRISYTTKSEGKTMLALAHFELLGQTEKREDVKVLVNKPTFIITQNPNGTLRKTTALLRDISAGGVCLISQEDLAPDTEFEMVYDLTRAVDVLRVQVVHKQPQEDGKYRYGCRFLELHFTQEHMVREYVFKRHLGLIGRTWRS